MKKILTLCILLCILPLVTSAQEEPIKATKPAASLVGEWTIDLRPTPDAEGYYQAFNVEATEENTFTGSFYGSSLENAILNKNWDKLYFAFTTKDQSNAYYHSGYLLDGKLYGMTYCPNRDFAAPWTGVKK